MTLQSERKVMGPYVMSNMAQVLFGSVFSFIFFSVVSFDSSCFLRSLGYWKQLKADEVW